MLTDRIVPVYPRLSAYGPDAYGANTNGIPPPHPPPTPRCVHAILTSPRVSSGDPSRTNGPSLMKNAAEQNTRTPLQGRSKKCNIAKMSSVTVLRNSNPKQPRMPKLAGSSRGNGGFFMRYSAIVNASASWKKSALRNRSSGDWGSVFQILHGYVRQQGIAVQEGHILLVIVNLVCSLRCAAMIEYLFIRFGRR